jgi:PTS system fructose-specific IIC component
MVMGLGVVSQAPHGGVFVLFAMNGTFLGFLASVAVGAVISAFLVVLLKRFTAKRPEAVADATVDQGVSVTA